MRLPCTIFNGLLCCLALQGCLRPSQERAERDQRVGQAAGDDLEVSVSQGLAAVRSLERERLVLWASAPSFDLSLKLAKPAPERFELVIENCIPGTQLHAESAQVIPLDPPLPTRCLYALSDISSSDSRLDLRLAPPNAEAVDEFRFAVMSDVQEAIDDVQDIYRVLNQQPNLDFLLGAGDLTQQGTREQLERFQTELEQLDIPYYTTLGNHELGESPPLYHDYFGRGSFSFVHRGVRFTLLDSGSATLDPIVYGWLERWLAQGKDDPHVVAMHIPPLDPIGVRNGAFASRQEAAKLLGQLAQAGVDLTLYGHIHSYYHFDNAGIAAHISGGGGAIPERFDGLGRHVLVVDVDPERSRFETSVVRVD